MHMHAHVHAHNVKLIIGTQLHASNNNLCLSPGNECTGVDGEAKYHKKLHSYLNMQYKLV